MNEQDKSFIEWLEIQILEEESADDSDRDIYFLQRGKVEALKSVRDEFKRIYGVNK